MPQSLRKLILLIVAGAITLTAALLYSRTQPQSSAERSAAPRLVANDVSTGGKLSFNRDIRPILSDKCFACHGPDAKVAKDAGGFRLDIAEGATVPAEASGKVPIIPGDAENSEVIKRIITQSEKLVMPPLSTKTTVTKEELALLKRWINEGAEYQGHWGYETPTKPMLPQSKYEAWSKNNIDRFVAARLEKAGLTPSKEADKATLIRRIALDLTGLPPTPEQIDAFVNDDSPGAYEKIVDHFLASPHFGERMAVVWLDAARYGDTNGYHYDNVRTAWPWRQWVIEAFNNNMPYDQFVTWQLAGDMLPNATQEQKLASGFCRMHNMNDEGGALDAEYIVESIADRIETIATVFMAQTYTCARCHDHKYDPTTQDDYFSTWAYFNSIDQEKGVYKYSPDNARAYPPRIMWKSRELLAAIDEIEPKIAAVSDQVDKNMPDMTKRFNVWTASVAKPTRIRWAPSKLAKATSSFDQTKLEINDDGSVRLRGKVPDHEDITLTLSTEARNLRVLKLDVLPVEYYRRIILSRDGPGNAILSHIAVKAVSKRDPSRTQDIALALAWADKTQAKSDFDVAHTLTDDKRGWLVDGRHDPTTRTALFVADKPFGFRGGTELQVTLKFRSEQKKHAFAHFAVQVASASTSIVTQLPELAKQMPLKPLALIDKDLRPEQTQGKLFAAWRAEYDPDNDTLAKRLTNLQKQRQDLEGQAVPSVVMKERAEPVPAYILERGAYDKAIKTRIDENGKTVDVEPQKRKPPSFVNLPMPKDAPNNRLGFAMWLTQDEHPLTARVHVNRLWQMIFGTGIVKTVEDFGSQAEWPSHPELLDYLAVDFVQSGWDQKALIKQILMSATYRQQAKRQVASVETDPNNRLLSYFPRRRLAGEFIRDQALYMAGLLGDQIGGPSVKPYQPAGLWNEVSIGGGNTARFKRDNGDKLYRRSMYTFWKKTSPPPQMATFNAPTREFCVVNRDVTNTPLQVLTLWNDEQFLEAARVLAQRTVDEVKDDNARLMRIFRRCTGHPPNDASLAILGDTLSYYRNRYTLAPDDAKALLSQGEAPLPKQYDPSELASWMMVASSVLSLDETIVRD